MPQTASISQIDGISLLNSIVLRPISSGERSDWDGLMAKHHYLGFKSLVGESIRYVALLQSHWVALLGWSAAALKCRPRDTWIGWPQVIQWQRLHLIANNSRFLILPHIHIPNLASKILSLNLKRLSNDWEKTYSHPVLVAETFVDIRRFHGTCYKAANWIYLVPDRKLLFFPISASGSNYNPRNTQRIPVVIIFAFLDLGKNSWFPLRHYLGKTIGANWRIGVGPR